MEDRLSTSKATCLFLKAAKEGNAEKVRRILTEKKCHPNVSNGAGFTALHLAALWGRTEVAAVLLDSGADSGLANSLGQTPLHMIDRTDRVASEEDRQFIIDLLLQTSQGEIDFSATDCTGQRPLQQQEELIDSRPSALMSIDFDDETKFERSRMHQMLLLALHTYGTKESASYQYVQDTTNILGTDGSVLASKLYSLFTETAKMEIGRSLVQIPLPNMVSHMKLFLETRRLFRNEHKSTNISIAYHYTSRINVEGIRLQGLLTKEDREAKGIEAQFHGSRLGDGVYTASNPYTSMSFGDVGIMVAQMLGNSSRSCILTEPNDSVVEGKIAVLRRSSQCIPLVAFHKGINSQFLNAYEDVVKALLKDIFNDEKGHARNKIRADHS